VYIRKRLTKKECFKTLTEDGQRRGWLDVQKIDMAPDDVWAFIEDLFFYFFILKRFYCNKANIV